MICLSLFTHPDCTIQATKKLSSAGGPLRRDTFVGDTLRPLIRHYIRKVGRPRTNWTEELMQDAAARFGGQASFESKLANYSAAEWIVFVKRFFSKPSVHP